MKGISGKLAVVLFITIIVVSVEEAQAQGKSGKGKSEVNRGGGPPPWAPAHGYRAKTRYVYFKDYAVYYDHSRSVYISISGGKWVVSAKLPSLLVGVNLVAAAKIDLDFDGDNPHRHHTTHKKKYPKGK